MAACRSSSIACKAWRSRSSRARLSAFSTSSPAFLRSSRIAISASWFCVSRFSNSAFWAASSLVTCCSAAALALANPISSFSASFWAIKPWRPASWTSLVPRSAALSRSVAVTAPELKSAMNCFSRAKFSAGILADSLILSVLMARTAASYSRRTEGTCCRIWALAAFQSESLSSTPCSAWMLPAAVASGAEKVSCALALAAATTSARDLLAVSRSWSRMVFFRFLACSSRRTSSVVPCLVVASCCCTKRSSSAALTSRRAFSRWNSSSRERIRSSLSFLASSACFFSMSAFSLSKPNCALMASFSRFEMPGVASCCTSCSGVRFPMPWTD